MRYIVLAIIAVLTLGGSAALLFATQGGAGKKTDEEKIIGSWRIVKAEGVGKAFPEEFISLIRFDFSKQGQAALQFPKELEKKVPAGTLGYKVLGGGQIDLSDKNTPLPGIYKFETDDKVTVCFSGSGKRPTEFSVPEGSDNVLFYLERAKADEKLTAAEKALIDKALAKLSQAAGRTQNANNLKQIAVAFHSYHDQTKNLPLHAIYSKDGKTPLLSWRVIILPYIEQQALYNKFKLDEPWDSEHNKKLIALMPKNYESPSQTKKDAGLTHYRLFTGPDTLFDGNKKSNFSQITKGDGMSNTLLIVDAVESVIWTQPVDLVLPAKGGKMPALGSFPGQDPQVAFCDASVRTIRGDIEPDILRALVTPFGKEKIDWSNVER